MKSMEAHHAESLEIVRVISLYNVLKTEQIIKLFPNKSSDTVVGILDILDRNSRLVFEKRQQNVKVSAKAEADPGTIKAFWVLLDFYADITFHTASDFPVALCFFAKEELYDVIVVPYDNETHVNHAVWTTRTSEPVKSIVVVDTPEQINRIKIPNVVGYCTVANDGVVTYFKVEKGACHEQLSFDGRD